MRAVVLALSLVRPAPIAPVVPSLALPRLALPVLPAPSLAPRLFAPTLPAGRVYSAVSEDQDAGLLAGLSRRPPKAVVMDYDSTLADRGPDGLSLPVAEELLQSINALLYKGIPVVIATSRHYELPGTPFPMDLKPFVDRIPAPLRRHLFISGGVGTELVGFDAQGRARTLWADPWDLSVARALEALCRTTAAELGLSAEVIATPGQVMLKLPKGDMNGAGLAEAVGRRLAERGYLYRVMHNKEFVYFSRSDKGAGLVRALAALPHGVAQEDLLVVGDEFGLPSGGDAPLAAAVPAARLVSVGDAHSRDLPPGVHRLRAKGGAGVLLLLKAVLAGLLGR
ncbi:MAG: hypothetical protein HY928_06980 [Elusimicrobia bacterium]|nr:hypothetical protein [Elusimicrobiota bacterium]